MDQSRGITVRRTFDQAGFVQAIGYPAGFVLAKEAWLFVAEENGQAVGGFGLLPRPAGWLELHTELQLRGLKAIEAYRELEKLLIGLKVKMLGSFVTTENKKAMHFAARIGFKRIGQTDAGVLYSKALVW